VRYVVLGAGAVGGTVGARLVQAGYDVALLARGEHAEVMRTDGLRVATPHEVLTVRPTVATTVAELALRPDDVLLLTTKTDATSRLLDDVASTDVGPDLPVFCVQNGVANERVALRRFARVYAVVVMLPAVLLEPGRIDAGGTPRSGLLDLGRYPHGTDDTASSVAAALTAAGFVSQPVDDIMRWKYAKLLRNLGNAAEALCGHDLTDEQLALVLDVDRRLREEAERVLTAAAVDWVRDDEWTGRRGDQVGHAPVEGRDRAGGSSWQSLARATGSVEADWLNGEIVLLGRLVGEPAPLNEAIRRLVNRAAREQARPGSMSPADLAAALDAAVRA
jgi:2-dehydropantoate 2-reductase